jgi:aminoglycoside phosphotransferase (APT) family kinase protein
VPAWDAEIEVDEALARALISARFPDLAAGSLRRVGEGWDNVVWATEDDVAFRFPRRQIAIPGVEREIALLPALAPRLPLAIPDGAYAGAPCERFRWPWFGSRLIAGREIAEARLDDDARIALAQPLGAFLRTLHDLDLDLDLGDAAALAPPDPIGRTDMAIRVPMTRAALAELAPIRAVPAWVADVLAEAEHLPTPQPSALVHGDLHVRHVLVDAAGAPVGVIDWGDVCRAHPSLDLSLYWSLFGPAGRDAFVRAYGPVDEHGLLRARVLALFFGATLATYAHAEGMPALEREALDGLARTLVG